MAKLKAQKIWARQTSSLERKRVFNDVDRLDKIRRGNFLFFAGNLVLKTSDLVTSY